MAKSDKTVKRGVYLYIDGKEIKNDINSIDLEMKRLQRDIKEMTRGSEEYNRTMAKIQHLQGILKQHRQEIKGITTETKKATVSIGSMVDWFNRFGGVILSVIGFLTGFTLALRAIRDERNKLEESQAGLKALTGLDDDSIAWLTGQAKRACVSASRQPKSWMRSCWSVRPSRNCWETRKRSRLLRRKPCDCRRQPRTSP